MHYHEVSSENRQGKGLMKADPKDVMLAILSASASIAGLVLVFSGFLVSQYMALDAERTNERLIKRLRNFARWGVVPFVCSILAGGLSFKWLTDPCQTYYDNAIYSFECLGIFTLVYGVTAFFRLV